MLVPLDACRDEKTIHIDGRREHRLLTISAVNKQLLWQQGHVTEVRCAFIG